MSVTDVTLEWTGQTGTIGGPGKNEYVASYRVQVNDTDDGPAVIATAPGLPALNSIYSLGNEFDTGSILKKITPKRRAGHQQIWDAVCKWQPPENTQNSGSGGDDTNPLLMPATVVIQSQPREEELIKAVYRGGLAGVSKHINVGSVGPPINSAHTRIEPLLRRQAADVVIRKSFNYPRFPNRDFNAISLVNAAPITLRGPGGFVLRVAKRAALLSEINANLTYDRHFTYWSLAYTVIVRNSAAGWDEEIVDRGYMAKAEVGDDDGRGGTVAAADLPAGVPQSRRLKDLERQPVSEPVFLDGSGQPRNFGTAYHYGRWQTYPDINFNSLLFMRRN